MKSVPNSAGKHGKPFSLAPIKFDDALKKLLATPLPEKQAKVPSKKKPAKHKR